MSAVLALRTWRLLWPGWRTAGYWVLAGLLVIVALPATPLGQLLNAALFLTALTLAGLLRVRAAVRARLGNAVAVALRSDPEDVRVVWRRWRGRTLRSAVVRYPRSAPLHEQGKRAAITAAVQWSLGGLGRRYTVTFHPAAYLLRVKAAPELPARAEDRPWAALPVVPLGVCSTQDATTVAVPAQGGSPVPVACWDPRSERDLLIAGVKGAGKTVLARGVIVRALALDAVQLVHIFDGKGSGDYAALEGRQGVAEVLRSPEQWSAATGPLRELMRTRYEQAYAYQAGRGPRPNFPRLLIVLDEVQRMIREPGMKEFIDDLARMARGANIRLAVITQRPDAADAVPGAIRDQLEDRVIVGWMSQTGARMVLDDDAAALGEAEGYLPRGRAVGRLGGRVVHFQTLWLPTPVEDADAEHLYPARTSTPAAAPTAVEPLRLLPQAVAGAAVDSSVEGARELVGAGTAAEWGTTRRARKTSA